MGEVGFCVSVIRAEIGFTKRESCVRSWQSERYLNTPNLLCKLFVFSYDVSFVESFCLVACFIFNSYKKMRITRFGLRTKQSKPYLPSVILIFRALWVGFAVNRFIHLT